MLIGCLGAAGGLYYRKPATTGQSGTTGADTLKTKPAGNTLKTLPEKDCQQKAIGNQFRKKEKKPKLENPIIFIVLFVPHLYLELTTT